tara:strand:+ start:154 stop:687 length:534 start_codon:yes stop_codon:yes gene_type:complete
MIKFLIIILNLFLSKNVLSNTWSINEQYDDFSETSFKYIYSNWVEPNKSLYLRSGNLKAFLWKGCESEKNYFNIEFSGPVNLSMSSYEHEGMFISGAGTYNVKLNVDGKVVMTKGEKKFGSNTFYLGRYSTFPINGDSPDNTYLEKILNSEKLKIQFEFKEGKRHFNFDLSEMPKGC